MLAFRCDCCAKCFHTSLQKTAAAASEASVQKPSGGGEGGREAVAAAAAKLAAADVSGLLLQRRPVNAPLHAHIASTPAAAAAAEAKATAADSLTPWREQDPLLFMRDLKKLGQVICTGFGFLFAWRSVRVLRIGRLLCK